MSLAIGSVGNVPVKPLPLTSNETKCAMSAMVEGSDPTSSLLLTSNLVRLVRLPMLAEIEPDRPHLPSDLREQAVHVCSSQRGENEQQLANVSGEGKDSH